jgi:hypothetical protein
MKNKHEQQTQKPSILPHTPKNKQEASKHLSVNNKYARKHTSAAKQNFAASNLISISNSFSALKPAVTKSTVTI